MDKNYSQAQAINSGRNEAKQSPAPKPQKPNEPANIYQTRVNAFNQTKKK